SADEIAPDAVRQSDSLLDVAVVEDEHEQLAATAQRDQLDVVRELEHRELEPPAHDPEERVEHGVVTGAADVDRRAPPAPAFRDRRAAGEIAVDVPRERDGVDTLELFEPALEGSAHEPVHRGALAAARNVAHLDPEQL